MTHLQERGGTPKPKPLSEAAIHKAVIAHWRHFGLPNTLVATVPNMGAMGQYGLTKGLPDLLILAPSLPVGFIELKSETGRVSEAQLHFQSHCERLRIPFAITRGREEPIRLLELWGVVREQA